MTSNGGDLASLCPCNRRYEESRDFEKILDLNETGLVIYHHLISTEDLSKNTQLIDSVTNTSKDVFVLHNTKDAEITFIDCEPEININKINCPRCRNIVNHAQRLLKNVSVIKKNVIMGICDHCRINAQIRTTCENCENIVKKFINKKSDKISDTMPNIRLWLSKISDILKNTFPDGTPTIGRSRVLSDLYIDKLCKDARVSQMLDDTYRSETKRPQKKVTICDKLATHTPCNTIDSCISLREDIKRGSFVEKDEHFRRQDRKNIQIKYDYKTYDRLPIAFYDNEFHANQISKRDTKYGVHDETIKKPISRLRKFHSENNLNDSKPEIVKDLLILNNTYYFPGKNNISIQSKLLPSSSELIKETLSILKIKANESEREAQYKQQQKLKKDDRKYTQKKSDKIQVKKENKVEQLPEKIIEKEKKNGINIIRKERHISSTYSSIKVKESRDSKKYLTNTISKSSSKISLMGGQESLEKGKEATKANKDKKKRVNEERQTKDKVENNKQKKQEVYKIRAEIKPEKEILQQQKEVEKAEKLKQKEIEKMNKQKEFKIRDKSKETEITDKLKEKDMLQKQKQIGKTEKEQEKEMLHKQKEIEKTEKLKEKEMLQKQREIEMLEKNVLQKQKDAEKIEKEKEMMQKQTEKPDKKTKEMLKKQKDTDITEKQKEKEVLQSHKEVQKAEQEKEKEILQKQKAIEKKEQLKEKEQEKIEKQNEKEMLQKQKESEMTGKQKEKEMLQKQREKEIADKQKEKNILQKQKDIEMIEKQKEKEILQKQKEIEQKEKQEEKEILQKQKEIIIAEEQKEKEILQKQKEQEKMENQKEKEILQKLKDIEKTQKQKEEEMFKKRMEVKLKSTTTDLLILKLKDIRDRNKLTSQQADEELNINKVKVRKEYDDKLILPLAKLKNTDLFRRNAKIKLSDVPIQMIHNHKYHKNNKCPSCPLCADSDLELDLESFILKKENDLTDIIIGSKIYKYKIPVISRKDDKSVAPELFKSESNDNSIILPQIGFNAEPPPAMEHLTSSTANNKMTEQEIPKGVVRYALSDRAFIDKGWTMLPTEKVVRKMNMYRMRPAHPEFDWFEHNKKKRLMNYDSGEKLAEFDDNGRGRWFYRSGNLALDYYDAKETNVQQRFVIYSSGEPDERGRSHPITILAMFDYLGNGVVFDHSGKIRLKYNQTEGVVLDREIGPVSQWKWHSLNDPPILQQVMIDTQMAHKDSEILKLGESQDDKSRHDNEEMLAIEFDNFIKEKSKKLTQTFKPFQIKMKALKINQQFSLKVLDQATIYLIFRDGSTNLKLNIGMLLDHKEIVDTDTAEVGEVSNNLERFPARTVSLAGLQHSIAYAQHYEKLRTERERRMRLPEPSGSANKLTAALSRPMRLPFQTLPSGSSATAKDLYCRCSRKPSSNNIYYDNRFL